MKKKFNNNFGSNPKKKKIQHNNRQNLSRNSSRIDSDQPIYEKFTIYIQNINTDQLKANDLNNLLNSFLNKSDKNRSTSIDSVKVYKDCLYILFQNEQDAQEACKFFHKFMFKSYKLECYLLNSLTNQSERGQESSDEEQDFDKPKTKPIDCEIIVTNRQLKKYADSVNDKLNKDLFGISTQIKYTDSNEDEIITKEVLHDAFKRDLLYLIYISESNEQFNSINLFVFNKWRLRKCELKINHTIRENKKMPLNKALEMLKSDYHDYINYLKEIFSNMNREEDAEMEEQNSSQQEKDKESVFNLIFEKFGEEKAKELNINDIDFLLTVLSKQKANLLNTIRPPESNDSNNNNNYNANNQTFVQNVPSNQFNLMPNQQPPALIPGLMPGQMPSFYPQNLIPPQINFLPPAIGNLNQPRQLMSLMNQPVNPAPSLMSLQTNFNNNNNNRNNSNFKRY